MSRIYKARYHPTSFMDEIPRASPSLIWRSILAAGFEISAEIGTTRPSRNRLDYGRYRTDTRVKIGMYQSDERGFFGFGEKRGFILRVIEREIGT